MTPTSPSSADGIRGFRHVALKVIDLLRSQTFYQELFSMRIVWQPDPDTVYLSSGTDNLALHQIPSADLEEYTSRRGQLLDHFGVIMHDPEAVDRLFKRVEQAGATVVHRPKQHRDGSYSFYLADPDGNTVQVLYEPTISKTV